MWIADTAARWILPPRHARSLPRDAIALTAALLTAGLLAATFESSAARAQSQWPVRFESASGGVTIPATLWKPEGDGPFPAVVIMHDCSGLGRLSSGAPRRWSRELLARGYVTLLPDSFSPRGLAQGVCTIADQATQSSVSGQVRAADALGALDALRKLTYVDKTRIGIMGGSHGGWATLSVLAESGGPLAEDMARRYPSDATVWVYVARAAANLGNKARAADAYNRVLQIVPGHIEASKYLGR